MKKETVEIIESQEVELTLDQKIELLQKQLKELKTQNKKPRKLKGDKVKFTTSKGEQVEGYGVLYYVVRHNGKLVYKEASTVEVLEKENETES